MKNILSNTAFAVTILVVVAGAVSAPFWFIYFVSLAWHMGAQ